jgi:hypothetical protein
MVDDIKIQILAYYDRCADDKHQRYRSWEHCFGYFQDRRAFDKDTAALNLAFYLASWGMYRGSSGLLQKDYKIHTCAVEKLLDPQYEALWDLDFDDASRDDATADLIKSLSAALRATYPKQFTKDDGTRKEFPKTDTLITKILLGTVGCTPALDSFFIKGFRSRIAGYSGFGPSFLREVFQFCRTHKEVLLQIQREIYSKGHVSYPMMKLVDMYFWEIGRLVKDAENAAQPC